MPRFAVGYANFFDNDLQIEIIEADDFREAIIKHSGFKAKDPKDADEIAKDMAEWFSSMPETMEDVKQFFFDGDALVDAIQIS